MKRLVRKDGCARILGTHFQMGKEHIGETVHVIYDDATIMFFGPQGTEIITPQAAERNTLRRQRKALRHRR